MKYFYDCEFEDDGVAIIPISTGFIAEDGRTLYLVNKEYVDTFYNVEAYYWKDLAAVGTTWLTENVMSKIPSDDPDRVPYEEWGDIIVNYLSHDGKYQSRKEIELWGYYAAYDHVCLAQVFGSMISLPEIVPMFTHEIMQIRNGQEWPERNCKPVPEHHALCDAIYQQKIYEHWSNGQ